MRIGETRTGVGKRRVGVDNFNFRKGGKFVKGVSRALPPPKPAKLARMPRAKFKMPKFDGREAAIKVLSIALVAGFGIYIVKELNTIRTKE